MQTIPIFRPEMWDSADVSGLVMEEEQLRSTSALWAHLLRPVARTLLSDSWGEALVLTFYIKADKPDMNACLNSMGSDLYRLFAIPLQRPFLPCELDIFSHLSSFACNLFYPYSRLQTSSFISCFPTPFLHAENPIYVEMHSHHLMEKLWCGLTYKLYPAPAIQLRLMEVRVDLCIL